MSVHAAKMFWRIALALVVLVILGEVALPKRPAAGPDLVAKTRQEVRRQGFKTDLDEFNFSTSPELRAREAALMALASSPDTGLPWQWPDLMEEVGDQSAVVVWSGQLLKWPDGRQPGMGDQVTWEEVGEVLQESQAELDAACTAALSGPIRFNLEASHGSHMVLRHLPALRSLQQAFAARAMLALHDGHRGTAWTNLVAATRLVTAWEPEPAEVSQFVRFAMTQSTFQALWQALQTNVWSDQQLAQIQGAWEAVDFWKPLPETAAFQRAFHAEFYAEDRNNPPAISRLSMSSVLQGACRSPLAAWSEIRYHWNQRSYFQGGQYEEQRDLLLFDQKREIEIRNAARAPTWVQMRQLPGVTNRPVFQTKYNSRIGSRIQMYQISMAFQRGGQGLLGRAAEAEARRRIIVTALALERYHAEHGAYPKTLAALRPEFLKTAPLDFMDGKPLRYQLHGDGHYLLYSIGLDCVDDGGKMTANERLAEAGFPPGSLAALPTYDLVWPVPAPATAVKSLRRQ